jgi:hypothetical protein
VETLRGTFFFLLYLLPKAPPKPSEVWPFILSTPVVIVLAPIPTVIGGISLTIHRGGGLYWAGFGLIVTLGYAVLFLWGLLFEPRPTDEDDQSHTRPDLQSSGPRRGWRRFRQPGTSWHAASGSVVEHDGRDDDTVMIDPEDFARDFAVAAEKARIDGWSPQMGDSLHVESCLRLTGCYQPITLFELSAWGWRRRE